MLIDNVRTTAVELLAATPLGDMPLANTAFEWSSDNSAVATVDANGTVTGHAGGSATIVGRRGRLEVSVTAMVQIPDALVIPVEANLGDDSWRITRSGVGSDMSITPDGNGGCALQFTVTNPRSANIALNKDIGVYSLPGGFSLTVDTKGSVLKEVSVRVRPDNASQPVMVSTGELSGATTVNCPLEGSIDIDDINVFPLHFSALRIVPSPVPKAARTTTSRFPAWVSAIRNGIREWRTLPTPHRARLWWSAQPKASACRVRHPSRCTTPWVRQ